MSQTHKNPSFENQNTIPSRAVHSKLEQRAPAQGPTVPAPQSQQPSRRAPKKAKVGLNWWWVGAGGLVIGIVAACLVFTAGMAFLYTSEQILPGVETYGIKIGNMSKSAATEEIESQWAQSLILTDGLREWQTDSAAMGISIEANATVDAAYDESRRQFLQALFGTLKVSPVLTIDTQVMQARLETLAPNINSPAVNAGLKLVNGQVQATPAQAGYNLDIAATLNNLQQNPSEVLADGRLELIMTPVQPSVLDASPLLAQATQLLSSPLQVQAFDPVRNENYDWSLNATEWNGWLVAANNAPGVSNNLSLQIDENAIRAYLESRSSNLDTIQYIDIESAIADLQSNLAAGQARVNLRVYHHDRTHTVQAGDTFWSLAYDYGIPYGWIRDANPGFGDSLSIGQTITIPSPDNLLPLPIIYNKRIVISIPQQRMWAYENDQLKWEWVVSTGIDSSPTAPGVFQVQSHYENAYAGNWDLWMPYFIGIYQPVPNIDFMNGFHGFPTRGGYQLLWTNSLGTRVTYGCILLSNENVQQLYTWAEEGVVVEIQG